VQVEPEIGKESVGMFVWRRETSGKNLGERRLKCARLAKKMWR